MLSVSLVLLAVGYGSFAFVTVPWQAFAAALVGRAGNGMFWPSQSTLLAALTPADKRPATWGMQRVVMNLGVGLGALVGGLVAHVDEPVTFELLFVVDALTFLLLSWRCCASSSPSTGRSPTERPAPRYRRVVRHRAFMGVIGLNTLFVFAGMVGRRAAPGLREERGDVCRRARSA